jgi:hypothetical protein
MKSSIGRRDFNKLAVAALGGLVAGTQAADAADAKKKDTTKPLLLQEPHVCRGLNPNCKGEVKGKKHDCAGQTNCASAAEHTCGGANDCAGLGGCGETPGENSCKGKGACAVPIMHDAGWEKARKNFEKAMDKEKKKYGPAPKKA